MYAVPTLTGLAVVVEAAAVLCRKNTFVLVVSTLARCDVTSWRARRTYALVRSRPFREKRPTDCGCRRCTRHRTRREPGPTR